jgi:hypothetical protein
MDNIGAETPIAELPAEDGVLDRALVELDERLTTWLAAMDVALRSIQGHAVDAAPEPCPVASADVSVEPAETASAAEPPAGSTADMVVVAPEDAAAPDVTPPDTQPAESDETPAGMLLSAKVTPESCPTDLPAQSDEPSDVSVSSATSEQDETEEVERLLASLDERTQAAVRVKRRLYGDQKSVRELLDETSQPEPDPKTVKPQPKRWWRRRSS